jgi:hypothetical protein
MDGSEVKEIDMGLYTDKDYAGRDIQVAVRGLTGSIDLTVTIEPLGDGQVSLKLNGKQLSSYPAAKYGKVRWTKGMGDLIQDELGGNALAWGGS